MARSDSIFGMYPTRHFAEVKFYDPHRGFGFATRADGGGDVFLPEREAGALGLRAGDAIEFTLRPRPDKHGQAVDIVIRE